MDDSQGEGEVMALPFQILTVVLVKLVIPPFGFSSKWLLNPYVSLTFLPAVKELRSEIVNSSGAWQQYWQNIGNARRLAF